MTSLIGIERYNTMTTELNKIKERETSQVNELAELRQTLTSTERVRSLRDSRNIQIFFFRKN